VKLNREFYKLPIHFDVGRLTAEVRQFQEQEWREHPHKYAGNSAMVLISVNGELNDAIDGPMATTEYLERCPYIRQVLAAFNTVFGRSRLMRLAPGTEVPTHNDVHYYWRNRVRIHIPIITEPAVRFYCGTESVHMAAGEAWIFDSWKPHKVINPGNHHRIHLVADTVGSSQFWNLIQKLHLAGDRRVMPHFLPFQPAARPALRLEKFNQPIVMPPVELDSVMRELIIDLRSNRTHDPHQCGEFTQVLDDLRHDWQATWVEFGAGEEGWPRYTRLLEQARKRLANLPRTLTLASSGMPAHDAVEAVLVACTNSNLAAIKPPARKQQLRIDRPVFIIAAPRSGSTLLFETLAQNREFWTLGDESHRQIESIPALHPGAGNYASNRLTAEHAGEATARELYRNFITDLRNSDGTRLFDIQPDQRPATVRLLEKTPKNALRIPFLRKLFPDARFVYLYRNPRDNISSLLDSWRSGRFVTYPDLPDWSGIPWSHLLIPGWQTLDGMTLAEIVAAQWRTTHETILGDLAEVPGENWYMLNYQALLEDTGSVLEALCGFCGIPHGQRMQELGDKPLRPSRYTLTAPDPDKWRRNATELETVLPQVAALDRRLRKLIEERGLLTATAVTT
jgi:hypothetical protein